MSRATPVPDNRPDLVEDFAKWDAMADKYEVLPVKALATMAVTALEVLRLRDPNAAALLDEQFALVLGLYERR